MTKTKKKIYEDTKTLTEQDPGGMTCDINVVFDDDAIDELVQTLLVSFYYYFKMDLKKNLKSYLTYSNFLGEADTYMADNAERLQIPKKEEKKARIQYARAIFNEFFKNIDSVIEYDENENTIMLSPYVADLEYGTYYRPAMGIISKAFKHFIERVQSENEINPGSNDEKNVSDFDNFNTESEV